ncbi:MAG: metallophosphoesterase [Eubacterium sp.]|nr:metallophosphoesterase [Eubacterium sp.]MCM1305144.1 metallophosphoesterase [Butyrivibrio sp.]MCM1344377.1 metallophosphoesterase [Muribaculaceae bacterium]MCM1411737.1 metallophosphoesterase [Lachnospiraceae bacterium]
MKRQTIIKIITGLIVFTAVLAVALALAGRAPERDIPESGEPATSEPVAWSPEAEEAMPGSTEEPEAEEIVYPAPEYDFKTDEIVVEIPGLEEEYTIALVNDLHMITDHRSGDVIEDNLPVVKNRYETLSVTEEGIHGEELWPQVIKYLNYHEFDAVIFAGDILDYCSNSNILALKSGLSELKYPADRMMYIRSDHDYGGWYGGSGFTDADGFTLQSFVLDADDTEKVIEFEEFLIVGINRSYRTLSEEDYEMIAEKLDRGKPVLIASHVPFYSEVDDSLAALSMEVRNRIYYWSEDGELYVPEGGTRALIDRMYDEDSNVVQIVAAHMHASWDGYVTDRLKEHIFAPTFQGNIGIIHITGGESEQNESREETEKMD